MTCDHSPTSFPTSDSTRQRGQVQLAARSLCLTGRLLLIVTARTDRAFHIGPVDHSASYAAFKMRSLRYLCCVQTKRATMRGPGTMPSESGSTRAVGDRRSCPPLMQDYMGFAHWGLGMHLEVPDSSGESWPAGVEP